MILISSFASTVTGQSYDLRFVEESNDGSTLEIKVQMSYTITAAVGSSNLVFSYNGAKVNSPALSVAHNFDQALDSDYAVMTLTEPEISTVSLNIELQADDMGTSLSAGVWTDVATVSFTILDNTGTADFQWEVSGTEETVAYLEDNSTLLSASGLLDESVPLPVELTSFEAINETGRIRLRWTTATELNNEYFQVLRSKSGTEWTGLGTVDGHGTTNEPQYYTFFDETAPVGSWYYKLKQVDFDGAFEYSSIIRVYRGEEDFAVSIYPSPTTGNVNVHLQGLSAEEKLAYRVLNLLGQELVSGGWQADEVGRVIANIDLTTELSEGTYLLQIMSDERWLSRSLLKQ
ncbi:MAG: T9SS type A sorting domain-containing protein [Cyclobacteriaceae bacterium]